MKNSIFKKLFAAFTVLAMTVAFIPHLGMSAAAAGDTPSFIKVNGTKLTFPDEQPYIEDGTTLVPIRFISEKLGYTVGWDNDAETVIMERGDISVRLPIGSTTVYVNGEAQTVSKAAILKNDRTFVPLRYISEITGATVDWWAMNNGITINALTSEGKSLDWFERCKQSELFVEVIPSDGSDVIGLDPKSGLGYTITRKGTTWVKEDGISFDRFEKDAFVDITIDITNNKAAERREIKELLKTFYPTGYAEVYELFKKTCLGLTGEEFTDTIRCMQGWGKCTSCKYTYDGRQVIMGAKHTFKAFIEIPADGVVIDPNYESADFRTPYKTCEVDTAYTYELRDELSQKLRDDLTRRHELNEW